MWHWDGETQDVSGGYKPQDTDQPEHRDGVQKSIPNRLPQGCFCLHASYHQQGCWQRETLPSGTLETKKMKMLSTVRGAPGTNGALPRATVPRTLGLSSEAGAGSRRQRPPTDTGRIHTLRVQEPDTASRTQHGLETSWSLCSHFWSSFSMKTPRLGLCPDPWHASPHLISGQKSVP